MLKCISFHAYQFAFVFKMAFTEWVVKTNIYKHAYHEKHFFMNNSMFPVSFNI